MGFDRDRDGGEDVNLYIYVHYMQELEMMGLRVGRAVERRRPETAQRRDRRRWMVWRSYPPAGYSGEPGCG